MTLRSPIPPFAQWLRRRATLLVLAVLSVAAAAGWLRMLTDIDDEIAAAGALARRWNVLADPGPDDEAALRQIADAAPLRHLDLRVTDAAGRDLVPQPPGRRIDTPPVARWTVVRPSGEPWHVSVHLRDADERREALESLAEQLGFLLLCGAGLLTVQQVNLRHALAPWRGMQAAIARLESGDTHALRALPQMPVLELETTASALRHLAESLDAEQARRRVLSQQLISLQEDERQRLARDLHDEFGQRLTALRLHAHWLSRQGLGDATGEVLRDMEAQVARLQADVRDWLARLQPFGGASETTLSALAAALHTLAQGFGVAEPARGPQVQVDVASLENAAASTQPLGQGLALAVYRMSQEALTNAVRHASAARVQLRVALEAGSCAPARLLWRVSDDGRGLQDVRAAAQRGTGLAGLRERAWTHGAELQCAAASADAETPGFVLSAVFDLALPQPQPPQPRSAPAVDLSPTN